MGYKLVIYDVSPFVYAVADIKKYSDKYRHGFPVGGMLHFLKYLTLDLGCNNDVILCFDSKSFRKELYPKYKAGRKANYSVYAQLDLLYEMLSACGVTCLKVNGYEADDLIYTVMERFRGKYSEIEIRGSDYDLVHNIVNYNEAFIPANSKVNVITARTFKDALYENEMILFNTISAYKVLTGDKSDNIPAFKSAKGLTGHAIYDLLRRSVLSSKTVFKTEVLRSRQFLEVFLKKLSGQLNELDYEALRLNMDLVFPKYCKEVECSDSCNIKSINKKDLASFLTLLNDQRSLENVGLTMLGYTETLVEKVKRMGKELRTGEYAADRGKTFTPVTVNAGLTNLREFK